MKYSYKFLKLGLQFAIFSAAFGAISAQGAVLFSQRVKFHPIAFLKSAPPFMMKSIVPSKLRIPVCLQAVFMMICLGMSTAGGAVLLSHVGDNNPSSEGWGFVSGGSSGLTYGASSFNGTPVWAINDSTVTPTDGNTHGAYYQAVLDASTNYSLQGWTLEANMQGLGGSGMQFAYTTKYTIDGTVLTSNNRKTYTVLLNNASGKMTIALSGYNGNTALVSVATTDLADIRLGFNPGDTGVSLYVNNQLIVDDYMGGSTTYSQGNIVWWGKITSTPGNKTSNWESIQFSTVPEPSPVALALLSLGMVIGFQRFLGRRKV